MAKLVGRIPANSVVKSSAWCIPALETGKVIKATGAVSAGRFPSRANKLVETANEQAKEDAVNNTGSLGSKQHDESPGASLEEQAQDLRGGQNKIEKANIGTADPGQKAIDASIQTDVPAAFEGESQPARMEPETEKIAEVAPEQHYSEGFLQGQKSGFDEGEKNGFKEGEQKGEEAGYKAGLEKGRQDGIAEAMKNFESEISEKRQLLDGILNVRQPLQQINEDLSASIVPLVTGIAEAVLNVELQTRPELIKTYVTESLKAMPHTTETVELAVHPDAVPYLSELPILEQWQVKIVEDQSLAVGSCKVSSSHSAVDQTLSQRLRECLMTVFGEAADENEIRALTSEAELNAMARALPGEPLPE